MWKCPWARYRGALNCMCGWNLLITFVEQGQGWGVPFAMLPQKCVRVANVCLGCKTLIGKRRGELLKCSSSLSGNVEMNSRLYCYSAISDLFKIHAYSNCLHPKPFILMCQLAGKETITAKRLYVWIWNRKKWMINQMELVMCMLQAWGVGLKFRCSWCINVVVFFTPIQFWTVFSTTGQTVGQTAKAFQRSNNTQVPFKTF